MDDLRTSQTIDTEPGWGVDIEPAWDDGHALLMSHAFLLLDGSGSMKDREHSSGRPKHRAVAAMVQDLIGILRDDEQIRDMRLTVVCYDGGRIDDVRLTEHDVKRSDQYYRQAPYTDRDLDVWDPLIGHGGSTPIGRALAFAADRAMRWVSDAPGGFIHRAVVCLLSDGMNYPHSEPDGQDTRRAVDAFNDARSSQSEEYTGRVRIATSGYYQHPPGRDAEEDAGRELLRRLAQPAGAYFESSQAREICRFLHKTIVLDAR